MNENVIDLKNITYRYNNQTILKDINITIKKGEFVGLIGPNGSGKSTLLKILLGLLPIQQGEVFLFGKKLNKFKEWNEIGYVSQKANSFNSGFPATVFEVVSMGLYGAKGLFKPINKHDKKKIKEAIITVGLSDLEKRNIGRLSGGQQQRAFIARALVNEPSLLILDEPTVGIDAESTNQFYELIEKLNKEKKITIILVSHDIGTVTKQVTSLVCLNKTLFFHGHPQEFNQSQNILHKTYGNDMGLITHTHSLEE